MKKRLLLHICCAPDQTIAVERTTDEYDVTGFFSNFCIEPKGEYYRRLDNAKYLARIQNIELIEDEYLVNVFLEIAKGLEAEAERGKRCLKCIEYRMRRTAEFAARLKFDTFATTLTVSPHKDADYINRVGEELAWEFDLEYLSTNFKKRDGFKRSVELSKKLGLYRQDYCGCRFSLRDKKKREEEKIIQASESTENNVSEKYFTGECRMNPDAVPPGAFYKPDDAVSRRFRGRDKK